MLLGPVEVRVDGRRIPASPLESALVALLALTPARTVSTASIVDALWGERPPASARTRVQALVSGVRRKLGAAADALATCAPGYALAPVQVDSVVFNDLLTVGRDWAAANHPDRACAAYDQAIGLWRGPALDGVAGRAGHRPRAPGLSRHRRRQARACRRRRHLRLRCRTG